MSGGSYNYIYSRLSEECKNRMHDVEMDDLIKDLCEVLHDLEWWQSCDSSEEEYRESLVKFKVKWFKGNREKRLKGYIDNQIGIVRKQLYALIGEPTEPKSEWQKDHEILKAYSDGANGVLDEIRAEIKTKIEEEEFARSVFRHEEKDKAKAEQCTGSIMAYNNMIKLIDKYKAESEESMPKRINASDIQPDDEWMQDNEWDEIYKQEDNLPDINVGNIKESEDKE